MNQKKLNKLTKKYIEVVTKDFDKPFENKKKEIINQDGGNINHLNNNIINEENQLQQSQNIISIKDILKPKKF